MAREVLLTFKAKLLAKAEELAKSVKVIVDETKTTAAEVSKDVRSSASDLKKRSSEARRAEGRKAKARARLGNRAGRIRGQAGRLGAAGRAQAEGFFQGAMTGREKAATALGIAGSKGTKLAGISTLLPAAMTGPTGVVMAGLVIVYDMVMGSLEALMEKRLARHQEGLMARVERALFEADYGRRLAEDPQFHRSEAEKAYAAMRSHQIDLARRGLTPRALGLLESF